MQTLGKLQTGHQFRLYQQTPDLKPGPRYSFRWADANAPRPDLQGTLTVAVQYTATVCLCTDEHGTPVPLWAGLLIEP